jgi:hypothetical protein
MGYQRKGLSTIWRMEAMSNRNGRGGKSMLRHSVRELTTQGHSPDQVVQILASRSARYALLTEEDVTEALVHLRKHNLLREEAVAVAALANG